MFNLSDPKRKSRSPSPSVQSGGAKKSILSAPFAQTGTTSMFDLSRNHGHIPGARPRPREASREPPKQQRESSREPPKKPINQHSLSSEPKVGEIKQEVSDQGTISTIDINKMIPVGSQKIPYEEIVSLLNGYVALPKNYWNTMLVYRQHIRYTRAKDNTFVRGGFIIGFGKQRGRPTLTLSNGFDPSKSGYYVWVIGLDAISHLFVKRESLKERKP